MCMNLRKKTEKQTEAVSGARFLRTKMKYICVYLKTEETVEAV